MKSLTIAALAVQVALCSAQGYAPFSSWTGTGTGDDYSTAYFKKVCLPTAFAGTKEYKLVTPCWNVQAILYNITYGKVLPFEMQNSTNTPRSLDYNSQQDIACGGRNYADIFSAVFSCNRCAIAHGLIDIVPNIWGGDLNNFSQTYCRSTAEIDFNSGLASTYPKDSHFGHADKDPIGTDPNPNLYLSYNYTPYDSSLSSPPVTTSSRGSAPRATVAAAGILGVAVMAAVF